MRAGGFSHSDISGSTPACGSPELIAANHVLHRLLAPRHPPCALSSLTITTLGDVVARFARSFGPPNPRLAPAGKARLRSLSGSGRPSSLASLAPTSSILLFGRLVGLQGRGQGSEQETWSPFSHRRDVLRYVDDPLRDGSSGAARYAFASRLLFDCQSAVSTREATISSAVVDSRQETVEHMGFEPTTLGLQSRCSPS